MIKRLIYTMHIIVPTKVPNTKIYKYRTILSLIAVAILISDNPNGL